MSNNRGVDKHIMEHSHVTDLKRTKVLCCGPCCHQAQLLAQRKGSGPDLGSCSSMLVGIVGSRGSSELERAQPATASTISSWDWTQLASVCKELHVTHMTCNV